MGGKRPWWEACWHHSGREGKAEPQGTVPVEMALSPMAWLQGPSADPAS